MASGYRLLCQRSVGGSHPDTGLISTKPGWRTSTKSSWDLFSICQADIAGKRPFHPCIVFLCQPPCFLSFENPFCIFETLCRDFTSVLPFLIVKTPATLSLLLAISSASPTKWCKMITCTSLEAKRESRLTLGLLFPGLSLNKTPNQADNLLDLPVQFLSTFSELSDNWALFQEGLQDHS